MTTAQTTYSQNKGIWWQSGTCIGILHSIPTHKKQNFLSVMSGDKH